MSGVRAGSLLKPQQSPMTPRGLLTLVAKRGTHELCTSVRRVLWVDCADGTVDAPRPRAADIPNCPPGARPDTCVD
eukprot:2609609-Prymnesium_polylepis.1